MAIFVTFFRGLRAAPIHEVVMAALLLARDRRMTLAKNIIFLESQTGQDPRTASRQLVWSVLLQRKAVEPPPKETWRLPYLGQLGNLLAQRDPLHNLGLKEKEARVQLLIDSICKS